MGNCCYPCSARSNQVSGKQSKQIVLLLVGLDNAGKTSAAKNLIGESVDFVVPTVGFSLVTLTHRGYPIKIYDLGGGPQIRDIWHRYFGDVHGVIFVIDASDVDRLGEGKWVLSNLLSNKKLAGKPLLVLANKQDREGALDELDIVERLDLEALVNRHKCHTMVETCSTMQASKRKLDPAIHNGYIWLVNNIIEDFPQLNARVEADMAEQKELDDLEKEARRVRINKLREERGDTDDPVEVADDFLTNPFQPINQLSAVRDETKVVHLDPSLDTRVILVQDPLRMGNGNGGISGHSIGISVDHNSALEREDIRDSQGRTTPNAGSDANMSSTSDLISNSCPTDNKIILEGVILVKESPRKVNNVDKKIPVGNGRQRSSSARSEVRTKSEVESRANVLKSAEPCGRSRVLKSAEPCGRSRVNVLKSVELCGESRVNGFEYLNSGLILVRESPRKSDNTGVTSRGAENDENTGSSFDVPAISSSVRDLHKEAEIPLASRRDPFIISAQSLDVQVINNVNVSITQFVKDQLELEKNSSKPKRRMPLRRANKTAPMSASSDSDMSKHGSRQGSRPVSREGGLNRVQFSNKGPLLASPIKKVTHLPPLKSVNPAREAQWTLPPLAPNPDLTWTVVATDDNQRSQAQDSEGAVMIT